jgi:ssDNA-binding Zn-finger/Zn-ribbon topoisomerase 1
MRFNGRCEKCTVCTGDVDKFVEKIWYKCSNYSNVHHVHEQCANKLLKNKDNKYICPVCKKEYELELVDPYMQSSIEEKKADITQFIKAAYLKEFLK